MSNFGDILAELRKDKGLSQEELGKILHLAGGTISSYERGISLPSSDRIVQLADYFSVTTDYLLGRTIVNISIDYLNSSFANKSTIYDLISLLKTLPIDRQQAILLILEDMYTCALAHKNSEATEQERKPK